jgi:tetratricopeptide (TPR) repeat protein
LIEAASNNHLWAEKLDGKLDDIFRLQDSLTMSIVSSVATRVERAELDRVRRKPTTHLDAYDLYQRAMSLWHEGRHDDAYETFCHAFALDSNFASAYAMAAVSLFSKQAGQGLPLSADAHAEALRLARLAAKLGQDDAYALARAAHVLANLGQQYELAMELANRATALNPNMGFAWLCKGWVSIVMGDGTGALASFATVLRLDPLDPAKARAWAGLACAHYALGDFENGYQWAQRAVEDSPAVWTLAYLVVNAVPTGRMEEARAAVRRIRELRPTFGLHEALLVCHTRDERLRAQTESSFIEAGIPE